MRTIEQIEREIAALLKEAEQVDGRPVTEVMITYIDVTTLDTKGKDWIKSPKIFFDERPINVRWS